MGLWLRSKPIYQLEYQALLKGAIHTFTVRVYQEKIDNKHGFQRQFVVERAKRGGPAAPDNTIESRFTRFEKAALSVTRWEDSKKAAGYTKVSETGSITAPPQTDAEIKAEREAARAQAQAAEREEARQRNSERRALFARATSAFRDAAVSA